MFGGKFSNDKQSNDGGTRTSEMGGGSKYKVFTLEYVLKRLLDYGEDKGEIRCR